MLVTGGLHATARHEKICETAATPDHIAGRFHVDPAKALVMTYIGQLVSDGYADRSLLDNGDVELRLFTGEVFLLADTAITCII